MTHTAHFDRTKMSQNVPATFHPAETCRKGLYQNKPIAMHCEKIYTACERGWTGVAFQLSLNSFYTQWKNSQQNVQTFIKNKNVGDFFKFASP